MPARIGMVFDWLWPAKPWQALQTSAWGAPGPSSGPAAAGTVSPSARSRLIRMIGITLSFPAGLAEHVLPDAVGPRDRVLRPQLRLAGSELLLDLNDLAALDLVAVDDRDGFPVAHPAVAGVAGRHRLHRLVVEQADDRDRADLPHRVRDVTRLRHRQPDRRVTDHVDALVLHRLVGEVVDLAPALVRTDQIRRDGDGPRALRRNQVEHVVLHLVAELRRHLARARVDLHDLVRATVLDVRIARPGGTEQRRLRDDVRVGVEHDELRLRPVVLEIPGDLARTLVRTGRTAIRGRWNRQDEHPTVGHRLELSGQPDGLWSGLPGMQHAVLGRCEALDLLPLEFGARRHDEPAVREITVAHPDPTGLGLDGGRHLVQDPDAVVAQTAVAEGDALDRAHTAQHEVTEGARHEFFVRLEQDDFDRGIGQTHVLGG